MAVKIVLFPVDSRAMGSMRVGVTRGRGSLRRVTSACLVALLAIAGAVGSGAAPAAASTGIFTSSPASPESIGATPVELDWSFGLAATADAATCEVQRDGSDFASVDCNLTGSVSPTGSVAYQASAAGSYVLVVTPSLLGVVQGADRSAPVVLRPLPATITPPTSPGADPTPHWSFSSADPAATATCSLADSHGDVIDPVAPCSGGYTAPDLEQANPTPAPGTTTTYTLTVTVADDGQTATATSSYDFVTTPGAPVVAANKPIGNSRHPGFTVSGVAPNTTLSCALTDPNGVDITATAVTGCTATPTINLAGEPDGSYTLSVTQTNLAGTSASGSDSYLLDTVAPVAPTLTPSSVASNLRHPLFALSNVEPSATLACTVSGPSTVAVSQCNAAGVVVNLAPPAADGTYTVTVTATDLAGNASPPASATYLLDTVAPVAPIVTIASASPSSSRTPIWYWQFGRDDTESSSETVSCLISNTSGWSYLYPNCPPPFTNVVTPTLGPHIGYDGTYTFTVTVRDEAGNPTSVAATYVVDSTVPEGPTVYIVSPRSGAGTSRHPEWRVSGPDGSTLSCELRRGDGTSGTVISAASPCDGLVSYSLVGLADGEYSLVARATDGAGNVSSAKSALYILAPPSPFVSAPASQDATAVWHVSGSNPADRLSCVLTRGTVTIDGPEPCTTHPTYDMSRLPADTYTLSVVQIGAQDVQSAPGVANWAWDGVSTSGGSGPAGGGGNPGGSGGAPTGGGPHRSPSGGKHQPGTASPLGGVIRRVIRTEKTHSPGPFLTVPFRYPQAHPNQFADGVSSSISNVATAIAAAGGGTGFPLLLLGLVVCFLIVQNRIDRRDPKLAFASAAADDLVEFAPPPSWKEGL